MIINLNKNDLDLIKELTEKFPNVFLSYSIKNDFENNPYTNYLIYLLNDKVVGFLNYYEIYERMEIVNFNVLDQFQNKHIGSYLLDELMKIATSKKIKNITLEVRIDNEKAIYLYKKYDFVEVGIRKNYYNGIDGILMECEMIKMDDIYILGIESSCDETSFSIVKNGTIEISTVISSQIDIHKKFGGVVPEIASRAHIKNITYVLDECLKKANMKMDDITAIAVTYGPGLIGSLLVGVECAKTLAFLYNKPLIPVHHISGHIYANNLVKRLEFPLIALVISGGHTELILMDKDYSFKKLGGTLDDAVGECYDKVGRVIGVEYPGGPVIDKLASLGKHTYDLPIPLDDDSYNFSFSGLKSAVINLAHNEEQRGNKINKENLACSFQDVVIKVLTKKTMRALKEYNVNNLILAGGVAANHGIREKFKELCEENNINYTFPSIKYSTDNAAMIASSGYYAYLDNRFSDLTLNPISSVELK
ncbi:MAG: tRNA (adenosine(37)-N6)-threonylcarbamoyltransferase complex transferase subunit TsaD [Bacilli bacterium]|nr:tRNA (adenosine(37)-N6)-threonylcarbamoyltransferase complex transferase subunit TsaD [Bacilli bacterium]